MKRISVFILIGVVFLRGYSQYNDLRFNRLTVEDGLSQSWVRCIHQDSYGYMWFGTKDGLNRYDGYDFKVFRYEENNPYSINNVTVNDILELPDGDMLIATSNGVDMYIRNDDIFRHMKHLPDEDVTYMLKDYEQNLWLGTDNGLYCFNDKDSSLTHYPYLPDSKNGISNNYVVCIFEDSQNNLWIGTRNGLNLFDKKSGSFIRYFHTNQENSLRSNYIFTIIEDRDKRLWIGSKGGGLDLFVNSKERPGKGIFKNYLKGSVWYLLCDRENYMWIGRGAGQGLNILDLSTVDDENQIYHHYDHEPENYYSLSDNSIGYIYEDKWGGIWIGTYGKGINYYSRYAKKFITVKQNEGKVKTIINNHVNVFLQDGRYLWIGSEGGLSRYDNKTGVYKHFTHKDDDPGSLGANAVYSIFKDSRGNLWIGTWDGGLNRYNYKSETFTKFLLDENDNTSIGSNNVFTIYEDNRGYLWIGTIDGGLNRFDYSTGKFIRYQHDPSDTNSIATGFVNSICQTSDGKLWISTFDVLDYFDYEHQSFHHYERNKFIGPGMSSADIIVLFVDSEDKLWIGTESGLILFDYENDKYIRYSTKNGLPNNSVKGILEDDKGNLWISTNNGISKFIQGIHTPHKPVFKNYDHKDGLQGNEFVKRSAYKNSDGYLFFGGTNGYTYFSPDSIKDNPIIPPLVFTDFQLFNKSVKNYEKDSPLSMNINVARKIKLRYGQSVFSFGYAALNYLNPEKNMYRYKLVGFDKEWNNVGNQRSATYTNLDPGNYTFLLQGSNNDGVWNKVGISIQVTVLPPWWKTWLFRISLGIALFILLLSLYRFRLYTLEKQKLILEKKVRERTAELSEANSLLEEKQEEITMQNYELANHRNNLEKLVRERTNELEAAKMRAEESDRLKSAFLANMSHEIRTPMNAIVGFATLLYDKNLDEEKKDDYIKIIEENSETLLVLINDILEISLIEAKQIKIVKREFQIHPLFIELEKYYNLKNDKKLEIKYIRNAEVKNVILKTDPVRFRQIISNLLSNAYKYTERGHIHFGYHIKDNSVRFYVEDSGIGIEEKEFENIFNYFHKVDDETKIYRGAGIGLSITRNLIELMGGKIWLESEINKGSVFYFTMPFYKIESSGPKTGSEEVKINWSMGDYRIIVAEDELTNYKLIQNILEPTNAEIIRAKNGKDVIDLIKRMKDLSKCIVLMDIKMPVMNGIEALKQLRKMNVHIPVIAITAYANESEKIEIMKNDFNDYMAKPLKPVGLLELISRYATV